MLTLRAAQGFKIKDENCGSQVIQGLIATS